MDGIERTFHDSLKMTAFTALRTGNPILDGVLSALVIGVITYLCRLVYMPHSYANLFILLDDIKALFYTRYSITFQGKHNFMIFRYDPAPTICNSFSDSFKALLHDVITTFNENTTIYEIEEYMASKHCYNESKDPDMYIVTQRKPFLYNKELDIYAIMSIFTEENEGDKKTGSVKTNTIMITLYSYKTNVHKIREFVDSMKQRYLGEIEQKRHDKKFIYTLTKTCYEESKYECWNEYPFESTRTFSNMFFEGKNDVIRKINYFMNNKEWYRANGIPYTLGIGLHGPPGTGKTSFFKCLANMTGRHLVILSLKMITTKQQLESFFFEDKYNTDNKKNGVGFDKKIIVIEDIDCMGDVILRREPAQPKRKRKHLIRKGTDKGVTKGETVGEALHNILTQHTSVDSDTLSIDTKSNKEDPITLDDILNLWDGLKETPGRILGISSNHYDKLDPALIRPGRIDITIHLDNVNRPILQEMFTHYYGYPIPEQTLKRVRNGFYSPAEIINFYVMHKDDPNKFMERILEHRK
jgi:broad-specificity NMP kinase